MRIESVLSSDEVKGMEELVSITGYSIVQIVGDAATINFMARSERCDRAGHRGSLAVGQFTMSFKYTYYDI
ncbi:hypothetical protein RR46_08793 [Papilio xuthus]|uniref:Uncharacterized protein n=1 Tax=Papilio xuthus TaxID=66420 RepID=A0A194PRF7_PAPXU|nr:hypothetical protein RR46_08793 [Papilio xuthus]